MKKLFGRRVNYRGDSSLPDYIKNLDTPFQVWSYLFTQSLEENIVLETKKYAGIHTSFDFSVSDLRKYIGILFYIISLARTPEIGQGLGRILSCGARKPEQT